MNGFEQLERLQLMITPQHFAKLGNNPLVFFFFVSVTASGSVCVEPGDCWVKDNSPFCLAMIWCDYFKVIVECFIVCVVYRY